MTNSGTDFLADLAQRVAASDAQADAELADILAGRPFKKRAPKPKADAEAAPAAPKKPRAKRKTTKAVE
jgi:hypothetical protein